MANDTFIKKIISLLTKIINSNILPDDCYLAGGTALYLYLKHRLSLDLDFFSPREFITDIFIPKIKKHFKHVYTELLEQDTITLFLTKEKIKFSLFHYPYQLLAKPTLENIGNTECTIASLTDIETMKTIAITQRGSAKDFIDLYFIIKKTKHSLKKILENVIKKYMVTKNYEYQIKTSLVYFDDAQKEINHISLFNKKLNIFQSISKEKWADIKNFFTDYIK